MRAKSILIGVAVLMVAATGVVAAESKAKAPEKVTFTGKVVDAAGKAVKGAEVATCVFDFSPGGGMTGRLIAKTTTPADGAFTVSTAWAVGRPFRCVIAARKTGLAMGWVNFERTENASQNIVLGKAETLKGVVVDSEGRPIAGAKVCGMFILESLNSSRRAMLIAQDPMPWGRTTTDARGQFAFTYLPGKAEAGLLVTSPGRAKCFVPSTRNKPIGANFKVGGKDVRIVMSDESIINGTVVDKKTGKAVDGVTLSLGQMGWMPNLFLDRQVKVVGGKFTVRQLSDGQHWVALITPPGQTPKWIIPNDRIDLAPGRKITSVKIELEAGGIIEVTVTDAVTNKPVPKALVVLNGQQERRGTRLIEKAGADGVMRFRALPGRYELVHVSGLPHHVPTGSYRLDAPMIATVVGGKTSRLTVALDRKLALTGVVRDKAGKPVQGAKVAVDSGAPRTVRTDEAGAFRVLVDEAPDEDDSDDEIGGDWIHVQHAERKLAASVRVPGSLKAEITLEPTWAVTGRLVDSKGKPLGRALVTLGQKGGRKHMGGMVPPDATTDAKGNFTIGLLTVGTLYRLVAEADGYAEDERVFALDRAGVKKLGDIALVAADGVISGLVIDANNRPVEGAKVSVSLGSYTGGARPSPVMTDAKGRFEIKGLVKGHVGLILEAVHGDRSGYVEVGFFQKTVKIVVTKKKDNDFMHPLLLDDVHR